MSESVWLVIDDLNFSTSIFVDRLTEVFRSEDVVISHSPQEAIIQVRQKDYAWVVEVKELQWTPADRPAGKRLFTVESSAFDPLKSVLVVIADDDRITAYTDYMQIYFGPDFARRLRSQPDWNWCQELPTNKESNMRTSELRRAVVLACRFHSVVSEELRSDGFGLAQLDFEVR